MHKVDIKIGSNVVQCSLFSIKEYNAIVAARRDGTIKEILPEIIRERFGDLPKHYAEQAFVKLFAMSKNKSLHLVKQCTCSKQLEMTLSPDNINVAFDNHSLNFDFGRLKIKARYPEIFEDDDVFEMINRCIKSVELEGQVIEWGELSESEIEQVLGFLTFDNIKELVGVLTEPELYVVMPAKCSCGHSENVIIRGVDSILQQMGA